MLKPGVLIYQNCRFEESPSVTKHISAFIETVLQKCPRGHCCSTAPNQFFISPGTYFRHILHCRLFREVSDQLKCTQKHQKGFLLILIVSIYITYASKKILKSANQKLFTVLLILIVCSTDLVNHENLQNNNEDPKIITKLLKDYNFNIFF